MKGFIKHLGKPMPRKYVSNYMENKDYRRWWKGVFEFEIIDKYNNYLGTVTCVPVKNNKLIITRVRDNNTGRVYYG